ncbi:RNase P subunit p30-domain-containing protein [Lactifluus volemus]|nr:RNase P subunit p30-domain-containing protein [Lactifluus volemus]
MYFDLNVPIPPPSGSLGSTHTQSNKGKGKQVQPSHSATFTPAQLAAIEARIDLLVHLGYSVLAFNQLVKTKVEPKTFINTLDPLLRQVKKRLGIIYLKRLTILLDEDSEKGFGLTNAQSNLFSPYDIVALAPTTETSFSLACLTHTQPSPLSAHVISVPLDVPRHPFRMKHTMVRTALRNGAVFEIPYASALDSATKRNWWAAAREVVRVTKGKGLIVTCGGLDVADLRSPKDIGNLITFLGLAQNLAHDTATTTPKSLVLRAQTRKTYRALFSEPKVVIPGCSAVESAEPGSAVERKLLGEGLVEAAPAEGAVEALEGRKKKRVRDGVELADSSTTEGSRKKRKGKKQGKID